MNDIATQYRIIAAGAGWAPKGARGRLRFRGADRVSFLHALLTNDIAALQPGSGTYALYLTPQGRMIADLHLFVRTDDIIADVPAELASTLARTFDMLIFSEDVEVSDVSASMRQFAIVGGQAAATIARACRLDVGEVLTRPTWSHVEIGGGFVAKTDDAVEGSYDLVIDAALADGANAELESAGAIRVSDELIESMRIDAGRPRFGVDMNSETIPLEAGLLERAISQTKGCYVGQEVIIRVLHRGGGRVAKRLVRVECGPAAPVPAVGSQVRTHDDETAVVTSAAWSARHECPVALGYVSRRS